MRSTSVARGKIVLSAFAVGSTLGLLLLSSSGSAIVRACPVPVDTRRAVWVELNSAPSNIPMDLVSFYDRTSGFQLVAWVGLFISAFVAMVLVVERSINYSRASRQTRLFISLANDALV